MTHTVGPCSWPIDICDDCCTDEVTGGLSPERWQAIQSWAAEFLWSATGRRFGLCERTYRPCKRRCGSYWGGLPTPWKLNGEWVNLTCGSCPGECGCNGKVEEVVLENTYAVTGVRIDGVDYDPLTTVAVYDHRRIIRADGGTWPGCQDLSIKDGPGAWSITVLQGAPVPIGGQIAAGLLACEMAKACLNRDDCALPRRIQTITRQGVTVGFQDNFDNLADLLTGIWEVDAFISSARSSRWSGPSITSIDVPEPAVLTWPTSGTSPPTTEGFGVVPFGASLFGN